MRVPSFHAFRSGRASVVVVLKQLWSWGTNGTGQLGLGDVTTRSSPVQVGALTDWSSISGGNTVATAIKTDGTLWSWGSNSLGELGLGNVTARSSPVQVGALTAWSKVSSGFQCAFAIKTDGTLWSWGASGYGRLGLGDTTNRSSPVQVGALTTWSSKIDAGGMNAPYGSGPANVHVLAIKTDGTLWSWGANGQGQLGLGNTTSRSSPVQVGALTTWNECACGMVNFYGRGFSSAIKTDGTLWTWGDGTALGLGDSTNRSSPVQVGALTTWISVSLCGGVATRGNAGAGLALRS